MDTATIQKVSFLLLFLNYLCLGEVPAFPPDEEIFTRAKTALGAVSGDFMKRSVRRVGNQTLELEAFIQQNGSLESFAQIAQDTNRWREWALHGINQKPGGGNYFVQLLDLKPHAGATGLEFFFKLNLPTIKKAFNRIFEISVEQKAGKVAVNAKSANDENSILSSTNGRILAFPAPGQKETLWIGIMGYAAIKNWLLYEALPEKLLMNESAARLQIILDNYTSEEIRQMESKPHKKNGREG